MPELSPQERERIYLEEKERLEARERIVAEKKKNPPWKVAMLLGFFGALSSIGTPCVAAVSPQTVQPQDVPTMMALVAFMGAATFVAGVVMWFTDKKAK